jgi:polysaccharide biosynthesis transport protein
VLVTNRDLIVHTHPKSSVAECCRTIRTNLTFMSAETPRKAIVVTSASPREGKTTVTMSLAISLAQSGKRVLIVDTDLRKPRVHRALGKSAARGVTSVLVGEHTIEECVQETEIPGLSLLASGPIPPNPSELLHTSQFQKLVADLTRRYDQVIIVIDGQKTTRDALRSALRQLRDVSCQIVGGVLNDVDLTARQYGYGAYYYYHAEGYYEEPPDKDGPQPPQGKRPVAQA